MFMDDMSRPIMLLRPWPIMLFLEEISWPICLFLDNMSRPIMFMNDLSRPIMFMEDMSRPIMLFMEDISRPIMLFMEDISLPIMFIVDMSRPTKLLALYMFDVSRLFLCIMLEDMSCPIWLLLILCMSSFLRELE